MEAWILVGSDDLTAELVVDGLVPLQSVMSPDGRWVTYVVTPVGRVGGRAGTSLWIAAVDGGSPPRRITDGTAVDSNPMWASDSARLYFLSDRTGSRQLYRLDPLSGIHAVTALRGEIVHAHPLWGSGLIAIVVADEPAAESSSAEGRGDALLRDEAVPHPVLRFLDQSTGEFRSVEGLGGRYVVEVASRPDGAALALISADGPQTQQIATTARLHVVDVKTGQALDLGPLGIWARNPVWWRYRSDWHIAHLARLTPFGGDVVFDSAAYRIPGTHRDMTLGMSVCPTELAAVMDGPPLALFADGLDTVIYRLDPDQERFVPNLRLKGLAQSLSANVAGDVIAVLANFAYEATEVRAGPRNGPLAPLARTRPALRGIRWGKQERLSYSAPDGLELDGLLVLPPGRSRADGPLPMVTLVHGGPDSRYADEFMLAPHPTAQWLATAGYAVFLPNPRGGIGHGREFAAAVTGDAGGDELIDILTGIDLLIKDGTADPSRLGIAGASHGGFMAAWAIGQTRRFKAAIVVAGISDWSALVLAGEEGALDATLVDSHAERGQNSNRSDRSPISFASHITTPTLLIHGENDTNVPVGQAIAFDEALESVGVVHQLVVYPREGHGCEERVHQLDMLHRTRDWFDRWLVNPTSDAQRATTEQ